MVKYEDAEPLQKGTHVCTEGSFCSSKILVPVTKQSFGRIKYICKIYNPH